MGWCCGWHVQVLLNQSHRTIDREVANTFRMLSEYLTTIAGSRPPITWIATVAQAHAPKWRNKSRKKPRQSGGGCVEDREKSGYKGEKRELDVSNPKVGFRAFEDHFEIDACQTGSKASGCDCPETF
jgi:hypothetical protein